MVWKIALGILVAAGILAAVWFGVSYFAGVAEQREKDKQAAIEALAGLRVVYLAAFSHKTIRGTYPAGYDVLERSFGVPSEMEAYVELYVPTEEDCYAILKRSTKANDYLEQDNPELIWFKTWHSPKEYAEEPDEGFKLAGMRVN